MERGSKLRAHGKRTGCAEEGRPRPCSDRDRQGATPIEDLEVVMSVEEAPPGSALSERLRLDQARAIFALLKAYGEHLDNTQSKP